MSNSREVNFLFFRSVEPVVVRAPEFVGALALCAELSVPLKQVTRNLLNETIRNPVDLGIQLNCAKSCFTRMVVRHFVLVRVPWLLGVLLLCSRVAKRLCV